MFYKNLFTLKKKTIILVGGNGLIGKEVLKGLLDFGAKVIVVEKEFNKIKNLKNIFFETLDISNLNILEKGIKRIVKKYGIPHGLINCSYPKTLDWAKNNYDDVNLKSFAKNLEIHLMSHVWIAKILAELMSVKKRGSIIQLGSIYGSLGQDESLYLNTNMSESITYPVIKGGVINSVRSMASHYGKFNLRVNSISPGGIEDNQNSKFINRYTSKTPLKRMAKAKDLVGLAIYLLSDASSYVTGIDVKVDGGWSSI
jgi:NAD(P)-dependent dehydrogenase (short-subunit alcohol dehydrogenase family)